MLGTLFTKEENYEQIKARLKGMEAMLPDIDNNIDRASEQRVEEALEYIVKAHLTLAEIWVEV